MSERLFIRLGAKAQDSCAWLIWSEQEQEIIASGELPGADSLASLTERAGNRPVDVLVPASSLALTAIQLPEKGQRQALKALPFMLEENLAQDVDDMHFVVGNRDGEALPVAAVAHEQMQTWLGWLEQAGLKARKLVPDCLALPLESCEWAAMLMGGELLLRTGKGTGHNLPSEWLPVTLPMLLDSKGAAPTIASYNEMSIPGAEVKQQPLDLPMLVLARGVLQAPMNLLTGVYKPRRELSKHLLQWKSAAIVVAVALLLALVNKGLTIYQVGSQAEALKAQSEAIYRQVVPGASRIVNLRSQLDSELKKLSGSGSGSEFFVMLQTLKTSFAAVPELKPNSLRFDSARSEIRMQITAKNYAEVEKFKELVAKDFEVDAGAMNNAEDAVTSTLTLRSR
ncbi:type II secretion system protein GspL [Shewanella sp. JM162201]|uniref:Type II secretion system protein L n=1 Tax=Shewanella jiangmenensis TaxID=2837387 RepID=A0ABS5V6M3_9GAMM|nr:type II secretion system protein GspL [Shewanella jiangmenensis]